MTFFFFNDTATTEIYTLSLHDALPISHGWSGPKGPVHPQPSHAGWNLQREADRKSRRLNSSHSQISYAVFCLKKKTHGRPARPNTPYNRRLLLPPPPR